MVKISDTNTKEFTFNKTIERESELISIIESYINLGDTVKKPLMIRCSQGWGQDEVIEYLQNMPDGEGRTGWPVEGHPLKQGGKYFINNGKVELISDHPELTSSFQSPIGYDFSCPPRFFFHKTLGWDYSWNPAYCLECVERYKIPFVYFVSTQWKAGTFDNPQGKTLKAPEVLLEFDSILYSSTIKGWLEDMAEATELPNKKRLKKIAMDPHGVFSLINDAKWDSWDEIRPKLGSCLFNHRMNNLIGYVESIKELDSYDDLLDTHDMGIAAIPYLLERVMDFYSSMFFVRAFWPHDTENDLKCDQKHLRLDLKQKSIFNLGNSFMKYLENTDDAWVFDFSKSVPEDILKEVQGL